MPLKLPVALVIAALLVVALVAFSSASAMAADSAISLAPAIDLAGPYVVSILAAVLAALLGWLSKRVNDWLGFEIDGRNREALHSAAMTGLDHAISLLRARGEKIEIDVRSPIVANAVDWVLTKGAPGAVQRFNLTPADVEAIVVAKLNQVLR
ncbi:MAG: hypothetical protein M0R28_23660 [Pigmentiphaga sp.]|nr:hypothetical protein [Pigmentiphaga sp.]